MKITADLHTHSVFSHGKGTVFDIVEVAKERGLKKIAITDHGPGHFFIGLDLKKDFSRLELEVDICRKKYKDIEILLGLEANLISVDGEIDVPKEIIKKLDVLLVGFHQHVKYATFRDAFQLFIKNRLVEVNLLSKERCREINTQALIKAIERYPIDVITHPGLKINIDTKKLALACKKNNTALEINCSYIEKTKEFVSTASSYGVKFSINSDAHRPEDVGNLGKGVSLAKTIGIDENSIINAN